MVDLIIDIAKAVCIVVGSRGSCADVEQCVAGLLALSTTGSW
jgi:hypothetical protein